MPQKTKKQHYVPQSYLKAWELSSKHQIYVFDKKSETKRLCNIRDVASERFFYDFNPNEFFPSDVIEILRKNGVSWSNESNCQAVEHTLAEAIEKPFSELLKNIVSRVSILSSLDIYTQFFISEEDKAELSVYLAFQFLRTKHVRSNIQGTVNCLTQSMLEMGLPKSSIDKYLLSEKDAKNCHIGMILDPQCFAEIARHFNKLTWMLGVNRTNKKFFTSDNPIGTQPHIKHPILSMNGIASKGVEVFFPLSPDFILVMVDGSYHTYCLPLERCYFVIKESNVDYYNSILAMRAERFVFSSDGDMTLLERMRSDHPDIFQTPHVQMEWNGKIFYPTKK